jgi:hypothetical protein
VAAAFARTSLLSQWAHGLPGLLWWCASDQTKLQHSPYDSNACENELGLLDEEGRVKPVLRTLTETRKMLAGLPITELPARITEAVCILNTQQDHWAVALGTFLLAKQAGFDLRFSFEDQELPEAPLYLLPCVTGVGGVPKPLWNALLHKVRAGATLYLSSDNGYFLNFAELTGLKVLNRRRRDSAAVVQFRSPLAPGQFEVAADFRLDFLAENCEVLAQEPDGNPVWSRASYGQGTVHFVAVPLEQAAVQHVASGPGQQPPCWWQVYRGVSEAACSASRVARVEDPQVGVTEHSLSDGDRVVVLINYSNAPRDPQLTLRQGWTVAQTWHGTSVLRANDATILHVRHAEPSV